MKRKKRLFLIMVTELCKYGNKPNPYWTYAFSVRQAKRQVKYKFNKAHGLKKDIYVEMHCEFEKEAKDNERKINIK